LRKLYSDVDKEDGGLVAVLKKYSDASDRVLDAVGRWYNEAAVDHAPTTHLSTTTATDLYSYEGYY
jgi:hypothetical protein